MNLTGKLKEQVEQAKTKEDAKKIIEEAGMELTDEEMNLVAGGFCDPDHPGIHVRPNMKTEIFGNVF